MLKPLSRAALSLLMITSVLVLAGCGTTRPLGTEFISKATPVVIGSPKLVEITVHNERDEDISLIAHRGDLIDHETPIPAGGSLIVRAFANRITNPYQWTRHEALDLYEIPDDVGGGDLHTHPDDVPYLSFMGIDTYHLSVGVGDEVWRLGIIVNGDELQDAEGPIRGEFRVLDDPNDEIELP